MCKDDIEITIKIPISDKPDLNGFIYPKYIIQKAIDEFNRNDKQLSLVVTDTPYKLGNIDNIFIEDDKLVFTANAIFGGTCEDVKFETDSKVFSDMKFMHVGLVANKNCDCELDSITKGTDNT